MREWIEPGHGRQEDRQEGQMRTRPRTGRESDDEAETTSAASVRGSSRPGRQQTQDEEIFSFWGKSRHLSLVAAPTDVINLTLLNLTKCQKHLNEESPVN